MRVIDFSKSHQLLPQRTREEIKSNLNIDQATTKKQKTNTPTPTATFSLQPNTDVAGGSRFWGPKKSNKRTIADI